MRIAFLFKAIAFIVSMNIALKDGAHKITLVRCVGTNIRHFLIATATMATATMATATMATAIMTLWTIVRIVGTLTAHASTLTGIGKEDTSHFNIL
jgi:hypothetical protein